MMLINVETYMKKIVHVVEALGGGVLTYLSELCNGMSDRYEVSILYGKRDQTPIDLENYFNSNIEMIEIKHFTREVSIVKDYNALKEIKGNLKKINPDIIHLHSSKAGALGRMLNSNRTSEMFYTPHGYSFLMKNESRLKKNIYLLVEKLLGNKAITIACSKGEYDESQRVTKKSTYVNNAIDTNYLRKFYNEHSNTEDVYFTIGRIEEQKNPVMFNKIAGEFPNKKFVWIGDGSLKHTLNAKNITVTGWMDRRDVLKLIQPYRFFLLTSKWEGLPISLLEAMYYEKIAFVTNIIGNNDTILDNYNGFLCDDESSFYKKIDMSLSSIAVDQIKENAKKSVEKEYSIIRMVEQYENIYFKR